MEIRIFETEAGVDKAAADYVAARITEKKGFVLGLPTGGTPEGMYAKLVDKVNKGELSFKGITTFNLDEYAGYKGDEPQAYLRFMKEHLFDHVDIEEGAYNVPNMSGDTTEKEATYGYENKIAGKGGIDLMVLGMGGNGHIGFNEPGTPFGLGVHRVELTEKTRQDNSRFFASIDEVPTAAITMGIRSIMNCRSLIMIVKGSAKAKVLAQALSGPVTEDIPASILQLHPQVIIFADKEAASCL